MPAMKSVQAQVQAQFAEALRAAFPAVAQEPLVVRANPKFGDYQCNNAMGMFKEHGKNLGFVAPGQVAEAIKKAIPSNNMFSDVSVGGPGFVSVKLSEKWIQEQVAGVITDGVEFRETGGRKRVVVDFSSPNIAKEMHVGHLRSTIIGESVCRILEFCGHEVHRLNHVGDWGTQFGMLIEYMKETYPNFETDLPEISDLQNFYKASKKRFDDDDEFKKRAQLAVVKLQGGDAFARNAWQRICDVSRVAFEKIYSRLGITVQERGESFYNAMLPHLVKELTDRGLCVESKGAMCVFTPRVAEIPLMAVKGDGGYGYDSTDLAAIYHRLFVMRADWLVYVTDLGQETHFHMIFDAADQAGWHRPGITRCDHMGFGVVQGEDKKKFKTRSGETVKLQDLLDEATERAASEIKARVEQQIEKKQEAFLKDPKDQQEAAERLGIAAVRYFDMKQNRTSPYVFNYERMLDPRGNSAVFLFYAYARIRAIQRNAQEKHGVDVSSLSASELKVTDASERDLALKLVQFPDTMANILADLHLHQLTDYLWDLCNMFTTFYSNCPVVGSDLMKSRLLLCEATRKVLHKAFFLLGFEPLERI